MSRTNPLRSLQNEQNLARRIAYERDRRGWTYDGVARRLTEAGCPVQSSAIFKIEKQEPPRRIVVDELVAFAKVFDTSVENLLLPLEVVLDGDARRMAGRAARAARTLLDGVEQLVDLAVEVDRMDPAPDGPLARAAALLPAHLDSSGMFTKHGWDPNEYPATAIGDAWENLTNTVFRVTRRSSADTASEVDR